MDAVFVELPAFTRHRDLYLDDEGFRRLQQSMMENPLCGDVIEGTGGLRKLRYADVRRKKGKRGGLRIIYYWWTRGMQFWLFTLYDKDELADFTTAEKNMLKKLLVNEQGFRK